VAHVPTESAERALAAASVAFAPALLALGWLILPRPDGTPAQELAQIDAASGRWVAAWVLILLGAALMVPASIALGNLVRETSQVGSLSGRILAVAGAIGLVASAAARGLHGAQLADDAGDPLLAPGAAAAWDGLQSGILRPFVYAPEIMAVGLLVIGLALVQRSPIARQAGWLIALGAAIIFLSLLVSQTLGAGIGAAVLLLGMLPYARHLAGTGTGDAGGAATLAGTPPE
jgi:hypothetical protein